MMASPKNPFELNTASRVRRPRRHAHARQRRAARKTRRSDAARPGELPGLEAFLAENGTALRRTEGNRRLLPAGRAGGDGLYALASDRTARRTAGPLSFAG